MKALTGHTPVHLSHQHKIIEALLNNVEIVWLLQWYTCHHQYYIINKFSPYSHVVLMNIRHWLSLGLIDLIVLKATSSEFTTKWFQCQPAFSEINTFFTIHWCALCHQPFYWWPRNSDWLGVWGKRFEWPIDYDQNNTETHEVCI